MIITLSENEMKMKPKVLAIADSPFLSTGFANVSREIYKLFKPEDYELHVFGMLDSRSNQDRDLPFTFWPSGDYSPMGFESPNDPKNIFFMVGTLKPDLIWIMSDSGTILNKILPPLYDTIDKLRDLGFKVPKIIIYPAVEGVVFSHHLVGKLTDFIERGHTAVVWTAAAVREIQAAGGPELPYIHFGADHADFRPYPPDVIKRLREFVGLGSTFLVGAVGTNKGTKNWPTFIKTAGLLKGYKDVVFYGHTDPDIPYMSTGHRLTDVAASRGVDNILWRSRNLTPERASLYIGDKRNSNMSEYVFKHRVPTTAKERGYVWNTLYSFIDKLNCFNLYLDVSRVEGWGLPIGEAMSCGVPTMVVDDLFARTELFIPYTHPRLVIEPSPPETWETWSTGAELLTISENLVASKIEWLLQKPKEDLNDFLKEVSEEQQRFFEKKWETTRTKMKMIVDEVLKRENKK